MEKLYEMVLNSILHTSDYEVLRVPGGWMYTRFSENGTGGHDMSSCFVPYNEEFHPQIKDISVPF